ncbi:hypothetical protein [Tsukamurella sp. PLM1]|uniref:hypothetical protein n=1 Tax=Tsukamurella sp. PLM1 TaxID=2929795 RepID=UPI0020C098AC|nr:hypothetical protein [Tsukamurella sp. PLM1]
MSTFEISFEVPTLTSLDDPLVDVAEDELDAFVVVSGYGARVTLSWEGVSAAPAGREAGTALIRHGIVPARTLPDLVSPSEIAMRASVTRQAVGAWIRGERGEGFPAPFYAGDRGLWLWGEVNAWLIANDRTHDVGVAYPSRSDHTDIDYHLLTHRPVSGPARVFPLPWSPDSDTGRAGTECVALKIDVKDAR